MNIQEKLIQILNSNNVDFQSIEHDIAVTCDDSARLRGMDKSIGGKSILFKDKRDYRIFTLSASLEVDSNKVRKILGSQRLRFATGDELGELCFVERGALPPIVKDIYPFDHYLDKSILDNEFIAFNAGILTRSIIIKVDDYLKLVDPVICEFSKS